VQFVTIDKLILFQIEQLQPGSGALLLQQLHQQGFTVTTYTVDSEPEWLLLTSLGIDGIYTNDISLGVDKRDWNKREWNKKQMGSLKNDHHVVLSYGR
jgi:hypothetical protein